MAKEIEMLLEGLTQGEGRVARNYVLDSVKIPKERDNFGGCAANLKIVGSQCSGALLRNKSITATAALRQPAAVLQTGLCHITLSYLRKIRPGDVAFYQNSLTKKCLIS